MTGVARRYWIAVALIAVAAVWGATFVMVKDAISRYPIFAFLGWRFAIALVAFVLMAPRALAGAHGETLRVGLLAGSMLTAGYVFQTWGLAGTTASRAAFITGMFVVMTPILQAVVLRRLPTGASLLAGGVAVGGLWLLTGAGPEGWSAGDSRVLACALAYSVHMIVLGGVGRRHDPAALTLVQLATVAVVCTLVSAVAERPGVPSDAGVWVALLITGVLASAVAFWVQTLAQRHISPTRTALILVSEPAFGGLFGWLWAGDVLGARGLAGAVLVLGGMSASELAAVSRARKGEEVVLEPALEGPPAPLVEEVDGGGV